LCLHLSRLIRRLSVLGRVVLTGFRAVHRNMFANSCPQPAATLEVRLERHSIANCAGRLKMEAICNRVSKGGISRVTLDAE